MKERLSPEDYEAKVKKQREYMKTIPPFSGRTWDELNDIYPIDLRINDQSWLLVGLMKPAYILTQNQYLEQLNGKKLPWCRFEELCYMQRCEEGKGALGFHAYPAIKGLNISGTLFAARKSDLLKFGLVEQMPLKKARLFRITWLGKMMIKSFVENLTLANNNIHEFYNKLGEKETRKIQIHLAYAAHKWEKVKPYKEFLKQENQ